MSAISNAYLIIFLPLISSLFCGLFSKKKIVFSIIAVNNSLLLLFSWQNLFNVLAYKKISVNFEIGAISPALEFLTSAFGASLLFFVIIIKSLIFLFFVKDFDNSLDDKTKRIFYPLYLFQFFTLAGIFTSNNFFNLIIFAELYIFTIFALAEIFLNQSQNTWKSFLVNSLTTLLILFSLIVVTLICSESNISKIAAEIALIAESHKWFVTTILITLICSLLLKFTFSYFSFKAEENRLHNFVFNELFFIKSVVAVFVILNFLYVFFGSFALLFIKKIAPFLILASLAAVSYIALKLRKENSFKEIFSNISAINLAIIFVTIAISSLYSLQSLFFLIANFLLVNLAFFLISILSEERIDQSGRIYFVLKQNFRMFFFPIKISLFFLAGFPLSFLFFSNWYLIKAAFDSIYCPLILFIIAISNLSYIALSLRLFEVLGIDYNKKEAAPNAFYIFGFLSLFLVIIFYFFSSAFLKDLSLGFGAYLLNL